MGDVRQTDARQMVEAEPARTQPNNITLAYLGAYGTHMFALQIWVGDGTSKTFFLVLCITLKMFS